jgi:hypothetical protein
MGGYDAARERMEVMRSAGLQVEKISDGLGFGEGPISVQERLDPEHSHHLESETLNQLETAIQSPQIIVPLEADDDGCGDGRLWGRIFQKVGDTIETLKRSLHRSKVFGGGAVMMAAAHIGEGEAEGLSVRQTMSKAISTLRTSKVKFGAHTDNHAHGDKCGCGAIDNAPIIIQDAVTYREAITATIGVLTPDTEGLDGVFDNFTSYAKATKDKPYAGRQVMDEIVDEKAVVKELEDDHLEAAIVLNLVPGHTVNQQYVAEATEGKAQVFAVDVPRLQELAEKKHPRDTGKQRVAFLSMLVYTLATAATLTKGDLPVYTVAKTSDPAEAPTV